MSGPYTYSGSKMVPVADNTYTEGQDSMKQQYLIQMYRQQGNNSSPHYNHLTLPPPIAVLNSRVMGTQTVGYSPLALPLQSVQGYPPRYQGQAEQHYTQHSHGQFNQNPQQQHHYPQYQQQQPTGGQPGNGYADNGQGQTYHAQVTSVNPGQGSIGANYRVVSGQVPQVSQEDPEQPPQRVIYPSQGQVISNQAQIHLSQAEVHQSRGPVQSQEQVYPDQGQIHQSQRHAYQSQGHIHKGQEQLHQNQGHVYLTQGQFQSSQVQIQPNQGQVHSNLVEIHQSQEQVRQGQVRQTQGLVHPIHEGVHQTQELAYLNQEQVHSNQVKIHLSQEQVHQNQEQVKQNQGQAPPNEGQVNQTQEQMQQSQGHSYATQGQFQSNQVQIQPSQEQVHQSQGNIHPQTHINLHQDHVHSNQGQIQPPIQGQSPNLGHVQDRQQSHNMAVPHISTEQVQTPQISPIQNQSQGPMQPPSHYPPQYHVQYSQEKGDRFYPQSGFNGEVPQSYQQAQYPPVAIPARPEIPLGETSISATSESSGPNSEPSTTKPTILTKTVSLTEDGSNKKRRGRPKKLILDPETNQYIDSSHIRFKKLNKLLKETTEAQKPNLVDGVENLIGKGTNYDSLTDNAVKQLLEKKDRRGRPRKFPIEQTGLTIKGIRVNGSLKARRKAAAELPEADKVKKKKRGRPRKIIAPKPEAEAEEEAKTEADPHKSAN